MSTPEAVRPRELALVFVMLAPLAVLFVAVPPITQDLSFHALADRRAFLGVPNFFNVVSSLGFLLVAFLGMRLCLGQGVGGAARSWMVFFFGMLLIAFGSAYYHWTPNNATLVWDRLPMTVAFMSLFAALISEHVRPEIERTLLRVAIAVGIISVGWWHYTGDLRLYAWVQLAPFLALVYVLIAFPARYTHRGYLLWGLVFYSLAKVVEFADTAIYSATGHIISGHTLKHLLAAVAPYCVYLMLRKRRAVEDAGSRRTPG